MVAVERLNNTTDVEWSRPAHPSGVCAARSRASSSRNASTFSLESSRVPSELIDTSSVPRWPGELVDPFLQLLDGLDGHGHPLSVLGGGASLVYRPAACPPTQRRIVRALPIGFTPHDNPRYPRHPPSHYQRLTKPVFTKLPPKAAVFGTLVAGPLPRRRMRRDGFKAVPLEPSALGLAGLSQL